MEFLDQFLTPSKKVDFFNNYFEKEVLFLPRKDTSFYKNLLNEKDIDEYLSRNNLIYPAVRMVKNQQAIPIEYFTSNQVEIGEDFVDGLINGDKMLEQYFDGGTIILENVERYFHKVSELCNRLIDFFRVPIAANVYLTPSGAQGFPAHKDHTDVFILQISGAKTWEIYNRDFEAFSNNENNLVQEPENLPTNNSRKIQIKTGDLLYIPRGVYHSAFTENNASCHITISIGLLQWDRVFKKRIKSIYKQEEFKKMIPLWDGKASFKELFEEKKNQLVKHILNIEDWESLYDTLNHTAVKAGTQDNSKRFLSINMLETLTSESKVLVNKCICVAFEEKDDLVNLCFYDKKISFPHFVKPTLDFINEKESITIQELPGDLDNESKVVLVKKLIAEGWLVIE